MSEHNFRYLLPPGNNFQFVSKFKTWLVLSCLLMAASIGLLFVNKAVRGEYMNWTIDFKGGTEIILGFKDKAGTGYAKVDPGKVRKALRDLGEDNIELSEITFAKDMPDGTTTTVNGMVIRTPRFSAMKPEVAQHALDAFATKFADRGIAKAVWSGDRMSVRSTQLITHEEAKELLATQHLTLKDWLPKEVSLYTAPDEGTHEYNEWFAVYGLDKQYEEALESAIPTVDVQIENSYGVGAKAGSKLRDDALKSLVYAIFLIMLYLAFRFDIRYAPGAAFATIHDAVMVIGVFALTWTEVSLVSVAGLLTVVGFSVNDTVVVFDRIRENQAKLKDKKIERVIDISINEVLVRSILTSSTVFATTLIMNIFGTGDVRNFAFAMNIGVIVGSYSSIFLAAPFFLWISKKWYSGPPKHRRVAPVLQVAESPAE